MDLGVWLCLLYMLSADQLSRHRKPGEKCRHLPPINFLCCPNSSSLASSLDPILILREVLVGLGWKGCPPHWSGELVPVWCWLPIHQGCGHGGFEGREWAGCSDLMPTTLCLKCSPLLPTASVDPPFFYLITLKTQGRT